MRTLDLIRPTRPADEEYVPYLVIRFRGQPTQRLELSGPITIGRELSNSVWVNDPKLSRRHCEIAPNDKGGWAVRDLDSRNGIYLNDLRVNRFTARDGESFSIGHTHVTFHDESLPVKRPITPLEGQHQRLMAPLQRIASDRPAHVRAATVVRPTERPVTPSKVRLVASGDEPLVSPFALPFQRPIPRVPDFQSLAAANLAELDAKSTAETTGDESTARLSGSRGWLSSWTTAITSRFARSNGAA